VAITAITIICSDRSKASTASRPDFTRASGFNLVHLGAPRRTLRRRRRARRPFRLPARRPYARADQRPHQGSLAASAQAPAIAEQAAPREEPQPAASTKAAMVSRADPTPTATVTARRCRPVRTIRFQPLLVKTVSYRIAPVRARAAGAMPALVAGSCARSRRHRARSSLRATLCRASRSLRSSPTPSSKRPPSRTSPRLKLPELTVPANPEPPKPSRQSPNRRPRSAPAAAG